MYAHKSTYVTVSRGNQRVNLSRISIVSLCFKCHIAELLLRMREGGREGGRRGANFLCSKSTFHTFGHKTRGWLGNFYCH